MTNNRDTVLVTGVSSGIGLALVRLLRHSRFNVVGTCRASKVTEMRSAGFADSESFVIESMDITSDEDRRAAIARITARFGRVDVLVNNAAVSYRSVIEDMSAADDLRQITTNYLGPLALSKLVIPGMRERRRGYIVNVSSVGGMMAMPTMGGYSASKFALEGSSEALWYELRPWEIKVCLVQPGFIRSDSFRKVLYGEEARNRGIDSGPYAACYREMSRFIEKCMNRAFATPETIAERIIRVLDDPDPPLRIPVTLDAHFFAFIRRFLPRRLYHSLLFHNLPGIEQWGRH